MVFLCSSSAYEDSNSAPQLIAPSRLPGLSGTIGGDAEPVDITTCTLALDADDLATMAGDRPFHVFTISGAARMPLITALQ